MSLVVNAAFQRFVRPIQLRTRRTLSAIVDRYLGITTTDEDVANRFGYEIGAFRRKSRALGWTSCFRILRQLPSSPDDVFLDLGCGAGRMTCTAARQRYARVIGIDIAPEFATLARENVATLRRPHARCEIVQADAATYTVPDDVTVIFLYNPFQGAILESALGRVIESYDRRPREIVVAYANPVEHERVSAGSRLRPLHRLQLAWRPTEEWRRTQAVQLYEVGPAA